MRTATIFQLLVASPSDVQPERELVKQTIFAWNQTHSGETGVVFEPLL